jgi:hypothetical protein
MALMSQVQIIEELRAANDNLFAVARKHCVEKSATPEGAQDSGCRLRESLSAGGELKGKDTTRLIQAG